MAVKLKEEGNKLYKEGNFIEAHKKYSQALKHDSTNSVIYSNRSLVSIKLKNYECALSDAVECIKHDPQWFKGFLRKAVALEGLGKHNEVKQNAIEGFRLCNEGRFKKELVSLWFKANKTLNDLPKGSIELPRGIIIMSQDYLHVLACLMQSLSGECPLSLSLTQQCLFSSAKQIEMLLLDFGECSSPIVKEWAKYLPNEVYPYSINPMEKARLEQEMKSRSKALIQFLNKEVDPTLYPLLRPVMGLVILIIINRTNILTECNTGHHAVELMNQALLPLFETSILSTDEYYNMYIGRLCAVVDSFIGRGYKLDHKEFVAVKAYSKRLEEAIQKYPKHLPEYHKDKQLAERALSNVKNNILEPAGLSPPKIPSSSPMSVEMAEQIVKERPHDAKAYIVKRLQDLEAAKFLTMGEVEELLTMTGIFLTLGDEDAALKVFIKGEQAFFHVFGQMLRLNTLKLDQCPAVIAPMRQLVLNQASMLKVPELFADVILRWKCLFKELRMQLMHFSSGSIFSAFYQWYMKQLTTPHAPNAEDTEAALLKQMQEEESLLQTYAESTLATMSKATYPLMWKCLPHGVVTIDYIFFAPLKENPLLEAYCVISEGNAIPLVCKLNYKTIHNQAALFTKLMSRALENQKVVNAEFTLLAKLIFPQCLVDILTSRSITHFYISPDSDIVRIPFDLLPVYIDSSYVTLHEKFSVSILPSMRTLFSYCKEGALSKVCSIFGNPNFDLRKPATGSSAFEKLINHFCEYFGISSSTYTTLEQLTHSQDEVDFISLQLESHGLNVQKFFGDQAVLSHVLSLESPMLLHISSHAYSGTMQKISAFRGNFFDDLNSSAIALAGFNTFSGGHFDQLPSDCGPAQLPPLAIFSIKLRGTKLVYLSTCDSASGTAPMQEAVDNLAEAFLVAGAETVIATLWPVCDEVAAEFSKVFYERLTSPGVQPSQALAHAKQYFRMLDSTSHMHWPSYAVFVCYGLDKPFLS